MRTNIEIDDELMKQTMAATNTTTKKAAVEAAMRKAVQLKAQTKFFDLCGKVVWRGHDDDWFASDEEILEKRRCTEKETEPASAHLPATEQPAISVEVR